MMARKSSAWAFGEDRGGGPAEWAASASRIFTRSLHLEPPHMEMDGTDHPPKPYRL
jgi:hypothetical protein